MRATRLWMALVMAAAAGLAACQGSPCGPGATCVGDPDAEVMALRKAWEEACGPGLYTDPARPCGTSGKDRSKELIQRQAENLLFRYPRHVPTLMFAALLAYEAEQPVQATEHLDTLLSIDPVHPEAVILRARIALEQGNGQYARRMLKDQTNLRPDHAGLQEALASAYYVGGSYEEALATLETAERLGAPKWRILYNRGLIREKQGNREEAVARYREALAYLPKWPLPEARLRGLGEEPYVVSRPCSPPPPPPPFSNRTGVESPDALGAPPTSR